jgi:flagellar biosynthesis anti-sigma factor FlgM
MIQPIRPQDATGVYQRQAVQGAEGDQTARRTGAGGAGGEGRRTDRVTISRQAQELHRAMEAVREQPDVRAERVARLQAQIAAGDYRVDADALARRLAESGLTL